MRDYTDDLTNEIRRVDGAHTLGAGALAEALGPWLAEHDRQVAEKAWDEGQDMGGRSPFFQKSNPYRKEARS